MDHFLTLALYRPVDSSQTEGVLYQNVVLVQDKELCSPIRLGPPSILLIEEKDPSSSEKYTTHFNIIPL